MSAEKTAAILLDELSPKFDGYRRALQQSAAVIVQLEDRVKALEARQPERGEQGEPGPAPTSEQIAKALESYLSENPPPKGDPGPQGDPGLDAEPIAIEDVTRALLVTPELSTLVSLHVAEAVDKYFEANPVRHGADGKDGKDANPITDEQIAGHVAAYLRDNPPPKGDPGADGAGIADILIDQSGCAVATFSDGRMKNLGPVIGKDGRDGVDGKNGLDGKDGASFDSFDLAYDDAQHEIVVRATAGSTTKEIRFPAGGIHYRGYWRDGVQAKGGEAWTHDGILWVAKRTTSAKPCVENKDDWGIGARKGRDGRDGKAGRDLGPPPPVKLKDDGESE